jgi:hypothetical protein
VALRRCRILLFRLGVELNHAQARQLAQQIQESIARERRSQTEAPDADDSMEYVAPVLKAAPKAPASEVSAIGNEARASDIVAAPGIVQTDAPEKPKSSGTTAAAALVMPVLRALPRASPATTRPCLTVSAPTRNRTAGAAIDRACHDGLSRRINRPVRCFCRRLKRRQPIGPWFVDSPLRFDLQHTM